MYRVWGVIEIVSNFGARIVALIIVKVFAWHFGDKIEVKFKVLNVFSNLFILFLQVKVHKLFNKFHVESLTPASLSLMHSPPDARNISEINMSSMEINTFRIRLR